MAWILESSDPRILGSSNPWILFALEISVFVWLRVNTRTIQRTSCNQQRNCGCWYGTYVRSRLMFRLANYLFRAALYSKCGEDEMIERFKKIERKFFVISRYANNNFQISSRCRIRTKFHSYPSIQQESYKVVFKLESTSLEAPSFETYFNRQSLPRVYDARFSDFFRVKILFRILLFP